MWKQSFSAGPSFRPRYFMIISLFRSNKAFPSISWRKRRKRKTKEKKLDQQEIGEQTRCVISNHLPENVCNCN